MSEEQRYRILEDIQYFGNSEPFWRLDLALPLDGRLKKEPLTKDPDTLEMGQQGSHS
jgi:hypothetical protein